jgi:hypothetical protein
MSQHFRNQARFHIDTAKGMKRTTVSLHKTLAQYVAIALGHEPESKEAHRAISQWLQQCFNERMDTKYAGLQSISYFLQEDAFELIADNMLSKKRMDWFIEE